MDNVGIVVDDLDEVIDFFSDLGLVSDGRTVVDGDWSGRVTGVAGQRVEIAMMTVPDGSGKVELSRFLEPEVVADHRRAPVDALAAAGVDAVVCPVSDDPDAAAATVSAALADGEFDAVEIGSGLRTSHEYTVVFERVVAAVIAATPGVPLCFNDSPESTLDAVRRALGRVT